MVGVTGLRFAGKSTVLSYLNEKHGFPVYSLASTLRELAERRGIPLTSRKRLQDFGDELRAGRQDGGTLARGTLHRIRADHLARRTTRPVLPRIAVGGFKHEAEITDVFAALPRFRLLVIDADDEVRFNRAKDTGLLARELEHVAGPGEPDYASFDAHLDTRDRCGTDYSDWTAGYGQSVDRVMKAPKADKKTIVNNGGDLHALFSEIDAWIAELDALYRSPG
jgi:hypothetical protein